MCSPWEPEPDSTILTALSDIMTPCRCDGFTVGELQLSMQQECLQLGVFTKVTEYQKEHFQKINRTFQRGKLPHYSLDLTYMWIISTVEMIRKWCRTWMKNVIEQRKRIMVKTSYKLESRHKLQRLTQQCWTCLSFVSINHCWQHPPLCKWQIPNPIMTVHDQNVPPPARSQV